MRDESRHILVVDDSAIARTSMRIALENVGHRVSEADCGNAALKHMLGEQPDLIITDLNMPGMDGIAMVERMNEMGRKCSVLVVTTEASNALKEAGKALGIKAWVHKPFQPTAMIQAIKVLTHRKG